MGWGWAWGWAWGWGGDGRGGGVGVGVGEEGCKHAKKNCVIELCLTLKC